ncbi:Fe(3+) dicitrate transport protein [Pseudarcicella hirudinis]|uniref:Fe(3+) dicitrate transport protein n=1 Tax=Pseudarcicella hirudinis TaxID=1079859 RepID=A0A1I5P199_9BACT|nr:TonB-dependent receptor [Pseudarcicella hirudinis]SFP27266.1 Fe(3+) dicitrate transport protein [Pseudarcicella hirudinis]
MRYLYILLTLFLTTIANAQNPEGKITGKVQNKNKEAIEGASVRIKGSTQGTITDKSGVFTLPNAGKGTHTLIISSVGYQTYTFKLDGKSDSSTPVEISLHEAVGNLQEVVISGNKINTQVEYMPDIHNNYLIAGKKNEVIQLNGVNGNIAEKNARQIFAKVPGVFVYDMDGTGNQVNISTRGLEPHRSWEFNIRQNGIITNSDMYGYPASHYSPAMESIERVELIRGSGSLQYGAQFGGMINYVTKQADSTRAFSFESQNSGGSFGLFSSYNAIGGKTGKLTYYAYYQKRHSDGYRKNSKSDAESQFVSLIYQFNARLRLKAELGRSKYVYQIPGPLTDDMFYQDPQQSTRSRNYFNPDIYVPSIVLDWKLSDRTQLRWTNSGVFGDRNSVMIDAFANVPDAIDPATNQYKNRQVDIDNFNSLTTELRLVHQYQIGSMTSFLAGGIQYMNNDLHRRQLGKGTTGSDFDLTLVDPNWGRDMHFKTSNVAVFVENLLYLTRKLTVSPGFRIENGATDMTGYIKNYKPEDIPNTIKHNFPLFGVNVQYRLKPDSRIYAGFSQAYRPVIFKDIIPGSVLELADKNLKDAEGYNLEAGINGKIGDVLTYDIGVFQLLYKNRLGQVVLNDANGQPYIFRTNVGNSLTNGVEAYIEYKPVQTKKDGNIETELSFFTSSSYFDATYQKGSVVVNNENKSIAGNRLESVPKWISRNGIQFAYRKFNATLQYSYVGDSYADAFNTETPSANGAKGLVPAYGIFDFNSTLRITRNYTLRLGINNFTNVQYFTKRPTMYPGAGVWSSDGRSIVLSFGIKL